MYFEDQVWETLIYTLTVKCCPCYLPRELMAVFVLAVHIPPVVNANMALVALHDNISSLQSKYPEGFYVVVGDFNPEHLTDTLPKLYQHTLSAYQHGEITHWTLSIQTNRFAYRAGPSTPPRLL